MPPQKTPPATRYVPSKSPCPFTNPKKPGLPGPRFGSPGPAGDLRPVGFSSEATSAASDYDGSRTSLFGRAEKRKRLLVGFSWKEPLVLKGKRLLEIIPVLLGSGF